MHMLERPPSPPPHTGAGGVYSSTVILPTTDFSLRANAVQREPQIQEWWATQRVYERLVENNPGVRGWL